MTITMPVDRYDLWRSRLIIHLVGVFAVSVGLFLVVSWADVNYFTPGILTGDRYFKNNPAVVELLGAEGLRLFNQHDRNDDGHLSPEEFAPLALRLINTEKLSLAFETLPTDHVPCSAGSQEQVFDVLCHMLPFNFSTLRNQVDDLLSSPLKGLAEWTKPNSARRSFKHSDFRHFLPSADDSGEVGSVRYMVKSISSTSYAGSQLSSNRYRPPPVHQEEITLHKLLAMFHSRPFIYPRFAPQGTLLMIRAVSDEAYDIVFRAHIEFQLNEPPFHPLWFTPAHFRGRLTIGRDAAGTVYRFEMRVPAERRLNVDLEWLTESSSGADSMDNMEVDIGHIGSMVLRADLPTSPEFIWSKEIDVDDAFDRLEKKFYPFMQVPYYPLAEALNRAAVDNKLVHSVVLWGALDDQSC